jgi:hypothetical protein
VTDAPSSHYRGSVDQNWCCLRLVCLLSPFSVDPVSIDWGFAGLTSFLLLDTIHTSYGQIFTCRSSERTCEEEERTIQLLGVLAWFVLCSESGFTKVLLRFRVIIITSCTVNHSVVETFCSSVGSD